jgi:hypothetical protein
VLTQPIKDKARNSPMPDAGTEDQIVGQPAIGSFSEQSALPHPPARTNRHLTPTLSPFEAEREKKTHGG